MRTTVTLDPDTEKLIRDVCASVAFHSSRRSTTEFESGLAGKRNGARRFTQTTYSLGAEQYFRWDKALAVADAIEDEELRRKLSLQK